MPLLMCDLDDTLVERAPVFRAWAEKFVADRGLEPEVVSWLVEQDRGGHRSRTELHDELVARLGYDASVEEFVERQEVEVGGCYRLAPGVRSCLEAARRAGWSLAVVTNGPVRQQTRKIEATGLDRLAAAVCISEEVGHPKPHAAMFEAAASRAGATLVGAWMLGDNLDADIAGARGVGVRSVWVRNPHEWLTFTSGTAPDLVADDLESAVAMVLRATA
ncbi:MAG: HAD family hydrolase [Nocardioidaceae bacterium]